MPASSSRSSAFRGRFSRHWAKYRHSRTQLEGRRALLPGGDPEALSDLHCARPLGQGASPDKQLNFARLNQIGAVLEMEAEPLDWNPQGDATGLAWLQHDLLERL